MRKTAFVMRYLQVCCGEFLGVLICNFTCEIDFVYANAGALTFIFCMHDQSHTTVSPLYFSIFTFQSTLELPVYCQFHNLVMCFGSVLQSPFTITVLPSSQNHRLNLLLGYRNDPESALKLHNVQVLSSLWHCENKVKHEQG